MTAISWRAVDSSATIASSWCRSGVRSAPSPASSPSTSARSAASSSRSATIASSSAPASAASSVRSASSAATACGVAGADRLQLGAQLGLGGAQRLQLGAQRAGGLGAADGFLAQLVGDGAQGVEPRAGLLALALQLLEPAAVVAGQRLALVTVDGRLAHALAQPLGVALERVDPLERRGQLGARALQLAVVLALDAGERLAQLGAGGVGLLAIAR